MTPEEIESAYAHMNYLFNSKEPVKARTRTVLIWDEEGYVNWLAFNLAMFEYFNTDQFTEDQAQLIIKFKDSLKGKDGHKAHYDFYGNILTNMRSVLKNGKDEIK